MKKSFALYPLLLLALLPGLLFSSCSSDSAVDVEELLQSVPADAAMVMVVNTESLAKKEGVVIDGKQMKFNEILAQADVADAKQFAPLLVVAPDSPMVIFNSTYKYYITGYVNKTGEFKKAVQEAVGAQFSTQEGVDVAGNYAIISNRFWCVLNSSNIDAKDVKYLKELPADRSFANNSAAKEMTEISDDVKGWAGIAGLTRQMSGDFAERSMAQAGLATVFDDAQSIIYSVNVEKDKVVADAGIYNSKGNPSKINISVEEVDVDVINKLSGTADGVVAMGIPNKMVKQIIEAANKQGPSMAGAMLSGFTCLDGTVAAALGSKNPENNFKGVVETDGSSTSSISELIAMTQAKTSVEGKLLFAEKGQVAGASSVSDLAKPLKGAVIGGSFTDKPFGDDVKFKSLVVKLVKKDGSLSLRMECVF